ncbi:MAG TPA: formyltransferase family protein, partial [Acidimicrobiales bacterium]|nr:formyltransferase family protein [Acidimicrobiales bacterium]
TLAAGVSESGCTVHVATEELDDGPILAQRRVPVYPDDDEVTLHERIKEIERSLYPEVVARVKASLAQGYEPASAATHEEK